MTNTNTSPRTRYYVVRLGWFNYVVKCGTGTRIIWRSWRRYSAMCFAAELNEAFADGKFMASMERAREMHESLVQETHVDPIPQKKQEVRKLVKRLRDRDVPNND